jgi:monofunctional biosynthetic peptidoglycan transglycosylase
MRKMMRRGLLVLLLVVVSATTGAGTGEKEIMTLIDFSRGDATWPHINDGVMGGVSSGEMSAGDGYATFQGRVSFENNGGFSSVRSPAVVYDLSMYEGLILRVRGDGKRYGFRLRTDASFDGVSYQVQIEPPVGEWTEISAPFTDFIPVYRGRVVRDHPPLDPSRIATFGLIISRQEGPFRIDVESVSAYPAVEGQEAER